MYEIMITSDIWRSKKTTEGESGKGAMKKKKKKKNKKTRLSCSLMRGREGRWWMTQTSPKQLLPSLRSYLIFPYQKERWIAPAGVHKHIYVGNPRCVDIAMQHPYPQVRGQDIFIVYRKVAGTYTDVQHIKVCCIPVLFYIQRVGSSRWKHRWKTAFVEAIENVKR